MAATRSETVQIKGAPDVVLIRQMTRTWTGELKFSLVDQTKMVTAASELARNAIQYAGAAEVTFEILNSGARTGLRITFEDKGPGMEDVELAMRDGYTTGEGLGLGLGGAKRLVNEFDIASKPGKGTRVAITRWK